MKKCFIDYLEDGELRTAEIDTTVDIVFTDGGFLEYETKTEIVQDELKNIVKIYFE